LTGEGLDSLRDRIFRAFDHDQALEDEGALLTHVRHEQKAREALDTLLRVQTAASQSLPHELLLLDLYVALRAVNSLTGETTVEDILDRIFSQFCVGK
jgi:tRNA modification GTPase